jgi:hypothetical protein
VKTQLRALIFTIIATGFQVMNFIFCCNLLFIYFKQATESIAGG